jgi:hypothetical protein
VKDLEDHRHDQPVVLWSMRGLVRKPFCFRAFPATEAYAAVNVTDGYLRPYGGTHAWVSEPLASGQEASIELEWQNEVPVREVRLVFNDDVNEDLINLHHHRTAFEAIPELVRDYRIEAWSGSDAAWSVLHRETNNHKRQRVHRWDRPIPAAKLRVVVEATNGSPSAELIEVRIYS